ncbi:MAG: tetratricopeptide repeat protein, partial [Planctomycetota bacterium]
MSQGGTPIGARPLSETEADGPVLHDLIRQGRSFSGRERHCAFLNLGDGTFGNVSSVSGLALPDDGRAAVRVDWDHDGDLDLWIANRNGPQLRLLQNHASEATHFLQFQLIGTKSNRDAIGARVELQVDGELPQAQTVTAGDGFLAQSSKLIHFGLRTDAPTDPWKVTVDWPGGERETFGGDLETDRRYELVQGSGVARLVETRTRGPLAAGPLTPPGLPGAARVVSQAQLPLPELAFNDLESPATRRLSDLNRPVLLNLWATWCAPCLEELQQWRDANEELQQAGIQVVALSVDPLDPKGSGDPHAVRQRVAETVNRLALPFVIGLATPETVAKLQLIHDHLFDAHRDLPIPTSILINSEGVVTAFYKGPTDIHTVLDDARGSGSDSLPFRGSWFRARARVSPFEFVRALIEQDLVQDASAYVQAHRARLQQDPEFATLLSHLGAKLLDQGQDGAVEVFQQAMGGDDRNADHYYNLGLAKQQQRDITGAITAYRRAIELEPEHMRSHNNLASALAMQGQLDLAIPHFRTVIRLDPTYAKGRVNFASALIGTGKLEQAVVQLQEAIKLEPNNAKAYNNLAV